MKNTRIFILSLVLILCFTNSFFAQPPVTETAALNKDIRNLSVDFDFKDADIKDVARAFSSVAGLNIIVSDDVKAKVTLKVKEMNWKEALGMVIGAYNITMLEKDNYIIITTPEKMRLMQESGDLQTQVVRLNFVDVNEIKKTLTSMLTKRGKIETDTRTNSLVITDITEAINSMQKVALELDTLTPQVMIEAMMLDVKLTNDEELGVDWTITHKDRPERLLKQTLGSTGSTLGELRYGKTLLPWANFSTLIDFWQEEKRVEILANPRILTLDNLTAAIDLVEQVPYTSLTQSTDGASAIESTQFKDAGVKLYVKPHITKDNYIFMNIKTEQSFRTGFTDDAQPIIDSRKTETNLMVKDGETVVIGGLRKKEDTTTVAKFPILGDIPLLGNLFKRNKRARVNTELIIFVTPYVITESVFDNNEKKQFEKFQQMKKGQKDILKDAIPFPLRRPSVDR